jgi:hypothetical protein
MGEVMWAIPVMKAKLNMPFLGIGAVRMVAADTTTRAAFGSERQSDGIRRVRV